MQSLAAGILICYAAIATAALFAAYLAAKHTIYTMSKTRKIIGWVLTGLLTAFLLFSASGKFIANPQIEQMNAALGLTPDLTKMIGVIEIIATILFVIPRTGVLGTLLLTAYLGGAIATHLEHPQVGPPTFAIIVQCVLWITAVIRFPELLSRISGRRD